ncbi:hypothetical protein LCGC14_2477920, partial [marine sediment metagenome]
PIDIHSVFLPSGAYAPFGLDLGRELSLELPASVQRTSPRTIRVLWDQHYTITSALVTRYVVRTAEVIFREIWILVELLRTNPVGVDRGIHMMPPPFADRADIKHCWDLVLESSS